MINLGISMADAIRLPTNPFPGLRPFEFNESNLFFGRDNQIATLIATLAETRFLAVVGTSGSGKSSLVRAGLLPALLSGMMTRAGSRWRIAITHPGDDPIGNLAAALNEADAFGDEAAAPDKNQVAIDEATLRRGSRGLVEIACQHALAPDENLLVLVDQFEEIFRFAREAARQSKEGSDRYENDSAAFIKHLLEARSATEAKIFVVLTMRSDFLGDCAKFWDLPEAINDSQYLIPRLTRDQLRDVITGPITLCDGQVTPRLLHQMLNDIIDDQDQLPVLQHLLMCIWNEWKARSLEVTAADGSVSKHRDLHQSEAIDLCCYDAVGGMAEALSRHAQNAYDSLPDDHQGVAEKLFKTLTEKGSDNREVRRPATVAQICEVAETTEAEVKAVVEVFREPGRSFLLPKAGILLTPDSVIDISHESLIRGWKLLRHWVDEETDAVREYRRLVDAAELKLHEGTDLWRGADLQRALKWRTDNQPNKAWADRYCPGFDLAIAFLTDSEAKRDREAADAERQKQAEAERAARELQQAKDLAIEREERLQDQKKSATRLQFWLRLSTGAVALAGISLLVVIILFIVLAGYYRSVREARNEAQHQADIALKIGYVANVSLAHQAFAAGYFGQVVNSLENYRLGLDKPETDPRSFLWYYLWRSTHNEQATLTGHSSTLRAVTFFPDGKTLASAGDDKTVKVWDIHSRAMRAEIKHPAAVRALAVSDKLLASADESGRVKLSDLSTIREVATLSRPPAQSTDQSAAILSVAFSPDGKMLAAGCNDGLVIVWEVPSGAVVKSLPDHQKAVNSVAFSPDGNLLASGSDDSTIRLWDLTTWAAHDLKETRYIRVVAFSPDSKTLAAGGSDRSISIWNPSADKSSYHLQAHVGDIYSIAFAPAGNILASASSDGMIKLWNLTTQKELGTLSGHTGFVRSIAFSPDGTTLASGSDDGTAKLWAAQPPVRVYTRPGYNVYSVSFSPDSQTLAVADEKQIIKLWDVTTLQSRGEIKTSAYPRHVEFTPDGKVLGAILSDGSVTLWDTTTKSELLHFVAHSRSMGQALAFSSDGTSLATGADDSMVKLWETSTGKQLAQGQHSGPVYSLSFSPDGKMLASGSYDKTVKLWDAKTLKETDTLVDHSQGVLGVAFSPDGKVLASASFDNTIVLWDVAKRMPIKSLTGHSQGVMAIAFSPDSRTLASVSYDHQAKLWDVSVGQELVTLAQESHKMYSVAFSRDGLKLATGGFDNAVKFWFAASPGQVPHRAGIN
jgi:WD40 repeat protein